MDAAIRKAKDSINQIFDKNLHDLVRGIRNHKENESKYIAECVDEIKVELKQDNMAVKANAINKLCYLQMMGYDISWAAFNIIEVMSSTKFTYKRIGYLAASQVFHSGTDVLMLTTNLLRKDLGSQNMYEAGTALSGLACFITPDLARDLASEIMKLMTSSRPYLRKKAVLIMYKIFLNYPDSLRPSFPRLKEKLDDSESSVQAAAVNVICELARKNPKNYLSLAPIFFKLMTISTNNWVLIKIIKLFGALTPLEPRLGKKLIEPLTNIINSTSAMSLLYECINTVLAVLVSISSGQPNHNSAIQVCLQKLRILIEDSDQNLKYLGLLAMSKILETSPTAVHAHKDLVMSCLDDKDESIRLRSLDLLCGMVTKKTLMEIVRKLMAHMHKAEGSHYRDQLLAKCVSLCAHNNYQFVASFEWYVSVLVELTRMEGTRHGKLLAGQMLDVAIRVESIRAFMVAQMAILVDNVHVFRVDKDGQGSDICEVLYAATWICGEFASCLENPQKTLDAMLKAKLDNLPGHIQAAFVQNIFKLYAHIMKTTEDLDSSSRSQLTASVIEKLHTFEQSADIEVQERACSFLQLLKYVQRDQDTDTAIDSELSVLFEGELNPVAPKAQKKVPVPEGLDLDAWINDPPSDDEQQAQEEQQQQQQQQYNENKNYAPDSQTMFSNSKSGGFTQSIGSQNYSTGAYGGQQSGMSSLGAKKIMPELSQDDIAKLKDARKQQQDSNPFYIKGASGLKKSESSTNKLKLDLAATAEPRSMSIDLKAPLSIPGVTSSDVYYRASKIDDENEKLKKKMKKKMEKSGKKSSSKKNRKVEEEEAEEEEAPTVKVLGNEMPEGAMDVSDDDDKKKKKFDPKDPHRALDIDLDAPLKDDEVLPTLQHRSPTSGSLKTAVPEDVNKLKDKKESSKKKSTAEKEEKKDKKEKKSSKKTLKSHKNDSIDLLVSINPQRTRSEDDYNELLSPEHEQMPSLTQNETNKVTDTSDKGADDLDFWLSTSTAPKSQEPVVEESKKEDDITKKSSKKTSKSSSKTKEKENGGGDEKSSKKKKSKKIDSDEIVENRGNEVIAENGDTQNGLLIESNKLNEFKPLVANKSLNIKYQIRANPMNFNQIIVKLRLKSEGEKTVRIYSIELNVLDTANIKLVRDEEENDSSESIKLGFSLTSNSKQQEVEIYFSVNDCTYAQVLKGNLIYMLKTEDSTIQEKLEFKLNVACSSFLTQTNTCDSDEFARFLSSGQLTAKKSLKLEMAIKYDEIRPLIQILSSNFILQVIEIVDNSASLFTSSIKNHPICLLIKLTNDQTLTIEGKSTNLSLLESLLEEFKSVLC